MVEQEERAGPVRMNKSADSIDSQRLSVLLGGLDPGLVERLLHGADILEVTAGTVLIRQGEPGDCAFVILTGSVDVEVQTSLGRVAMARLGAQQLVGEIAIFTDLPRTATVTASEESSLLRIGRGALAELIRQHPDMAFGVIGALGRRVDALNKPLALLTLAAQALEQEDLDPATIGEMLGAVGDQSPFAQSFQRILREMQAKSARRHEMEFAARLQQSILPRTLEFGADSSYRAAAFMRPARDVGGDFYDFFQTADGRKVMVVADVSGKGIPASLFMAVSRTLIRAMIQSSASLEDALARANAQLESENEEGLFVTVFAVELSPASGALRYVNAGHCDGYLLGVNGDIQTLGPTGPALAMIPGRAFPANQVALGEGELLFVPSDGVTEAFSNSGDMFGEQRLIALLSGLSRPTPGEVLAGVDRAVVAFADGYEQSDDITCLAVSRT